MRNTGKSVLAVVVGFVAVVVLSLGTDEVFHLTGVYPPWGERMSDGLFGLATAYRLVYGILGSYITARLAPQKPMKHAIIGALIGMVFGTVGVIVSWKHPEMGPHWYPIALVLTGLPCAWIGGKLRENQLQASAATAA